MPGLTGVSLGASLFDPLMLARVSADVLAMTHGSPEALEARQAERLAALLDVARNHSRLYRKRLARLPADVALEHLPIGHKQDLMNHFEDWVTDPRLARDPLLAFVRDRERIADAWLGEFQITESSGSTGEPGLFVQDARALAVYDALESLRRAPPWSSRRALDPFGLTDRHAFIGALDGHFASIVSVLRLRRLNPWMAATLRSFSILQSPQVLVEELNAWSPTVIATYPTAAGMLADEAAAGRLKIRPREVWTGGETLTPAVREAVRRHLGAEIRNSYGSSEFISMGWECAQGSLHINSDWVLVEQVDADYKPLPAGTWSDTTLITNLANHVQPIIRYDLGDQTRIRRERCACGSLLPVIEVRGRRDDPLLMQGAKGEVVTLLPLALSTVLEDEAGVFDFHVRQLDARTLKLHVGGEGATRLQAVERCHVVLQAYARRQGLATLNIVDGLPGEIPRGRSGKAKRIERA